MAKRRHKPICPGEVLKRDFMGPLGVNARKLSMETGISAQHLGRIIKGTRGLGVGVALKLGRYFRTSPRLWMDLQSQYELDAAEKREGKDIMRRIKPHRATRKGG